MSVFASLKPTVSRRTLLLAAGCAWTLAGCMLIGRALTSLIPAHQHLPVELAIGIGAGLAFYLVLFVRISDKHITRITRIPIDNPCFFSFFNLRSYVMMFGMIGLGITLRKLDIIDHGVLYTVYLAMGIPLLVSSFRFFYSWAKSRPAA